MGSMCDSSAVSLVSCEVSGLLCCTQTVTLNSLKHAALESKAEQIKADRS